MRSPTLSSSSMLVRTKEVMFSTCFMDTVRWNSSMAWLPLIPNCRLKAAA